MESSVFFVTALVLDIVANSRFGSMLTDSTDVIAITPELTAPQLLLDTWYTRKDFACGQTLDNLHDLGWAVAGHRLNQKMPMIPIRPDFEKGAFIPLGDFQTDLFQDVIDFFIEDDSSVFGRADDMVPQDRYVMSFSDKVTHAAILSSPVTFSYS